MSVQPILNTFEVTVSLLAINFQMPSYEASGDHLNIYTDLFLRDITLNELQSHTSSLPCSIWVIWNKSNTSRFQTESQHSQDMLCEPGTGKTILAMPKTQACYIVKMQFTLS